jgi:hypothetical protein
MKLKVVWEASSVKRDFYVRGSEAGEPRLLRLIRLGETALLRNYSMNKRKASTVLESTCARAIFSAWAATRIRPTAFGRPRHRYIQKPFEN